jgi:hypothetical protein
MATVNSILVGNPEERGHTGNLAVNVSIIL